MQYYKTEYDIEVVISEGKTKFDRKRGKHVNDLPEKDYVSRTEWTFFSDLKNQKLDDNDFKMACKLAKRSFQNIYHLKDSRVCPPKIKACKWRR